ncbi:AraC family transcriptional regulator [Novosphingobium aquiterrae]|uniref:AraC family transcriptional regulator n=1 Tax=Novosphingobium aquiterrae TaxID=624388 RepID=A0ABV6PIT0_9SPHN
MQIAGRGRVFVWQGASLWVLASDGKDSGASVHAHHAHQVTLSLEGGFVLSDGVRSCNGPVAAVAADHRHGFTATGKVALLFIEPESTAGRVLTAQFPSGASLVDFDPAPFAPAIADLNAGFAANAGDAEFIAIGRDVVTTLCGEAPSAALDTRVQAMIDQVRATLDDRVDLASVADRACLSPSRARHLFAAETGLPFKAFVLWQRLERAVACYAAGHSLTEAAHLAGFADSAHLSRTFRKTFGIPASQLEFSRPR